MGWFEDTGGELGIDPSLMGGNTGTTGGANMQGGVVDRASWLPSSSGSDPNFPNAPVARTTGGGTDAYYQQFQPPTPASSGGGAPQAGARPNQSPQDFIKQWQAANPASGGIAPLSQALQSAGYGDVSRFMYGQTPSNNELNIGGQKYKVLSGENSSNPSWYAAGTDDSGGGGFSGGGFGGSATSNLAMPTAPQAKDLTAPAPFSYGGLGNLGTFTNQAGNVPAMGQLAYNPMQSPGTLSYQNLATPAGYQAEKYQGLSADQLKSDPSYQFRFDQGQKATENALAHAGALRTGNALTALTDYGQGAASQEYAAADARARNTVAQNNQSSLGAYQTNAQTGLAYGQANNQNALQFGNQNFQNAFAVNQANNQGSNAAIQGNNANALAAQGQQFGQGLSGFQANLAGQQQGYNQALGAYGQNAQTQLAYGSQNQQNQLANYQAQVNAALGLGNLNLGYQNSAQNYALGQGNLGLAQQGQQFNQGLQTYDRNYQATVTDPWNQQMGLANLGNPGAPNTQGNANAQGDLYTQQGNANAAGQVGAANAWGNAAGNIGQSAQQLAYMQWLNGQQRPNTQGNYVPGQGLPLYY